MADEKTLTEGLAEALGEDGIDPNRVMSEDGTVSEQTQAQQRQEGEETETTDATAAGTSGSTEAQTEVDAKAKVAEEEAAAVAAGTPEPPKSYFEVDLSGLPAEERTKLIDALKERDDEIGKLLRGKAEGETAPVVEEPEPPKPMTDEDILRELGLDPENTFDETAIKIGVPLVRALQGLTQKVDAMSQDRELEQLDSYWNDTLDKLEKDNGKLEVDRIAVLEFAGNNGIVRPEDAYWRIAGPARRQVEAAMAEAQKRIGAAGQPKPTKQEVSSTRPKASGATEEVPTTAKTVRDAVQDQAGKILRDLGIG